MPGEWDLEMRFHQINNAFINCLSLSFLPEDRLLPYYLRANADVLHWKVRALHVNGLPAGKADDIDYALIDFLGVSLKPQAYETSMNGEFREDYAMLFTSNSLRGNVKNVVYWLNYMPAPECIFPELFGGGLLETFTIATYSDPRPWIGNFIETFKATERGTNTVQSVTLLHRCRSAWAWPSRNVIDMLGEPRRTDIAPPHSAFIKQRCRGGTMTESIVASLFAVENAKAAKKLEIYAWTTEETRNVTPISLHYAFLLMVVDI